MFTKWTGKEIGKAILLFAIYVVMALAAMWPGFYSPLYWVLFSVAAGLLMTGPLTVMMAMKRGVGSTILLPLLLLILSKLVGELAHGYAWVPFMAVIVVAEVVRDLMGAEKLRSIRIAAPIAALCIVMWNNGFYFGGQDYLDKGIEEMGAAYIEKASSLCTPMMYAVNIVGTLLTAIVSERLTEKIAKIK